MLILNAFNGGRLKPTDLQRGLKNHDRKSGKLISTLRFFVSNLIITWHSKCPIQTKVYPVESFLVIRLQF